MNNFIFLIVGVILGFLLAAFSYAKRIWGEFIRDKRDPEKYIFRFEWTKDPIKIENRKYIVFKVIDGELKSIKDPD